MLATALSAIEKVGIVFNVSVCVSTSQKVVVKTCLMVWNTT